MAIFSHSSSSLWEVRLLYRLIEQILPFRGKEAENFLKRYYFGLNREQRKSDMAKAFRLDDSVGEVNAIDKLLAREEAHRVIDYRLCLKQIDQALRNRIRFLDPYEMPAEEYVQLYEGWLPAGRATTRSLAGITQSTITPLTSSICCADTPSRPLFPIRNMLATLELPAGLICRSVTSMRAATLCLTGGRPSRCR